MTEGSPIRAENPGPGTDGVAPAWEPVQEIPASASLGTITVFADKPPAEPAVIALVRQLLSTAEPARAVLIGFETVMRDFEAAFGFESPPEWTYADVFRLGVRYDMGYLPVLLARLYRIYEPIRYGLTGGVGVGPVDVLETLRQIYNQPPLRLTVGLEPGLPMGARERGIPIRFPLAGATPPGVAP